MYNEVNKIGKHSYSIQGDQGKLVSYQVVSKEVEKVIIAV